MKRTMSSFIFLAAFGSLAMAEDGTFDPNSYECLSAEGTSINYTTTSLTGQPQMNVKFRGQAKQWLNGKNDKIQEEKNSALGSLVTAEDLSRMAGDGPGYRYTLVLPGVRLNSKTSSLKFETNFIFTVVPGGFAPPGLAGVILDNTFMRVNCTAKKVIF